MEIETYRPILSMKKTSVDDFLKPNNNRLFEVEL